jgi:DNA-binding transcriptional LysR family regulator
VTAGAHFIDSVLSAFLHCYAEHYPNVQVKLIEGIGGEVLAMVERGDVQLGIIVDAAVPAGNDHFGSLPILPVEFWAAHHTSRELGHGRSIDIRGLAPYPLLVLESSYVLRKTFDAACRIAGVRPNILIECRSLHTLLALAEAGHGVAVVPSYVPLHRYTLKTVRLTHQRKPLQEPRSIFWDKRRSLPRYAQDFCELLAEYIRKGILIAKPPPDFRRPNARRK